MHKHQAALDEKTASLPSYDVMLRAESRLDMMEMLFERQLMRDNDILRYVLWDSSPQAGYNLLLGTEKRITIPSSVCRNPQARVNVDISKVASEHILPTAALGSGCSGVRFKLACGTYAYFLESGSAAAFERLRRQVRGVIADQGAEDSLADAPFISSGGANAPDLPALLEQLAGDTQYVQD